METTERVRYGPRPRITAGATASWAIGIYAATVFVRGIVNGFFLVPVGVAGLVVLLACAVLWWRHRGRGVYVSDSRVWVKHVFRTDSVPLGQVAVVDAMPAKPAGVRRLVLHLEEGRHLPAPLRGYADGRDDPYGPRDVLSSAEFAEILDDLQQRVTAAA